MESLDRTPPTVLALRRESAAAALAIVRRAAPRRHVARRSARLNWRPVPTSDTASATRASSSSALCSSPIWSGSSTPRTSGPRAMPMPNASSGTDRHTRLMSADGRPSAISVAPRTMSTTSTLTRRPA